MTISAANVAGAAALAVVEARAGTANDASGDGGGGAEIAAPARVGLALAPAPVLDRDRGRGTTISHPVSTHPIAPEQQAGHAPGRGVSTSPAWGIGLPHSWREARGDAAWPTWLGRHAAVIPLLLALLALALSLPRLTTPDTYVFDEIYYAYTAGRYVSGEEAYSTAVPPRADPAIEWTHPPLAKLLIAGGILVAGDHPLGWRIASVLFGVVGVVIAYSLALALTGNRLISALAAGLLLLDGLYLVESRTGMSNLFLLVFANGALLGLIRVLTVAPERAGLPLLATGICLGLAIATKWSAVALAGLIGLVVLWRFGQIWRRSRDADFATANMSRALTWRWLRWAGLSLIAAPLAIYFASYLHFFAVGHGWADFLALHRDMLTYHRELGVVHDDSSPWWQWPLAARGIWYYAAERRREVAVVFGNGNPLLYWPMVVAVAWVMIDWWGRRPLGFLILAIGFLGQWLPWALSPRGTFIYHFLPVVPLGCLALAVMITDGWRQGGWARGLAAVYVVAVLATFIWFYPISTAMPLSPHELELRMWLPSWR